VNFCWFFNLLKLYLIHRYFAKYSQNQRIKIIGPEQSGLIPPPHPHFTSAGLDAAIFTVGGGSGDVAVGLVVWAVGVVVWAVGVVVWAVGLVVWAAGLVMWAVGLVMWAVGLVVWAVSLMVWAVGLVVWAVGLV
jgi:hypothetical protein